MNMTKLINKLKPIKTVDEYHTFLALADKYIDAKKGSVQSNIFNIITMLIEKYEEEHINIPPPDPIEAIKFRMEQLGVNNSDVAKMIGGKSRVSEILNRKRKLTVGMMKTLHHRLGVPAESLLNN